MNHSTALSARTQFLSTFSPPGDWTETHPDDHPFEENTDELSDDVSPQWCIASYHNPTTDTYVEVWLLSDNLTLQPYYDLSPGDHWGDVGVIDDVASSITDTLTETPE